MTKNTEKGSFGYLKNKKKKNLLYTIIAFAIVIGVFVAGYIVTGSRNNYCTLAATVLALPAAKIAVGYFILLPHKSADLQLMQEVSTAAGKLNICYDLIYSNHKKPIGTLITVISDKNICAYTQEINADTKLFETSLKEFLKNEKLNAAVTLYKDKKNFINKVKNISAVTDMDNKNVSDRVDWNTQAVKNMCL